MPLRLGCLLRLQATEEEAAAAERRIQEQVEAANAFVMSFALSCYNGEADHHLHAVRQALAQGADPNTEYPPPPDQRQAVGSREGRGYCSSS